MSADAKIWRIPSEDGWDGWTGSHDAAPTGRCGKHTFTDLQACVTNIEACLGQSLRWEFGGTPDTPILKGYRA